MSTARLAARRGLQVPAFAARGHKATGVDGSERFAQMAREHSGCTVRQQDFIKLDLPSRHCDGVSANAAPLHVPGQALPRVLSELFATLKPGGVLFSSNPHGNNDEGWIRSRYGAYHDIESRRAWVEGAGFVELTHYYRPPGLPRDQQPWLASVWRRANSATVVRCFVVQNMDARCDRENALSALG